MLKNKKKIKELENKISEFQNEISRINRINDKKTDKLKAEIKKTDFITDATLLNHKENIENLYKKIKTVSVFFGILTVFTVFAIIILSDNEILKDIKSKAQ